MALLSLSEIYPHLLVNLSESELIKSIASTSLKFTKDRQHIDDYAMDPLAISAYAAFYLPTNILKIHFLLSKLPVDILEDLKKRTFIDIGVGPGTFLLGMKMFIPDSSEVEFIGVDRSAIMLKQAQKMASGFFPGHKFIFKNNFFENRPESILFFGHSINEMGVESALKYVRQINPHYVMWIEPGTSEVFKNLLHLRAELLNDYDVLYPCPSNSDCPSLWCHQVLRATHHQSIERISQLVGLDRKILPLSAHLYRRRQQKKEMPFTRPAGQAVTIRFINETKFSFEYEVCRSLDDQNINSIIEILKKDLSKEKIKYFKESNIGDYIDFEIVKELKDKLRVSIKKGLSF